METGVLIIGNGIAGLSTALFLAEFSPSLPIILLDKSLEEECHTKYAQEDWVNFFNILPIQKSLRATDRLWLFVPVLRSKAFNMYSFTRRQFMLSVLQNPC